MMERMNRVVLVFLIVFYQAKGLRGNSASSSKSSSTKSTTATDSLPTTSHTTEINAPTTVFPTHTSPTKNATEAEARWHFNIIGPILGGVVILDIVLILTACYKRLCKSRKRKRTGIEIAADETCLRIIGEEMEQSTGNMYANFDVPDCPHSTEQFYVNNENEMCAPSVEYSNVQVVSRPSQSFMQADGLPMIEILEDPFYDVSKILEDPFHDVSNCGRPDNAEENETLESGQILSDENGRQTESCLYSVVNKPKRN